MSRSAMRRNIEPPPRALHIGATRVDNATSPQLASRRGGWRLAGLLGSIQLLVAACGTMHAQIEQQTRQCLEPGETTLADAVLCLGVPSHTYEDGHILVYPGIIGVLGVAMPSTPPRFHEATNFLPNVITDRILVFDDHWLLRSHAMRPRLLNQ